jgi:hypothetical protein
MHPARSIHKEVVLEQHLVEQLVASYRYLERNPDD